MWEMYKDWDNRRGTEICKLLPSINVTCGHIITRDKKYSARRRRERKKCRNLDKVSVQIQFLNEHMGAQLTLWDVALLWSHKYVTSFGTHKLIISAYKRSEIWLNKWLISFVTVWSNLCINFFLSLKLSLFSFEGSSQISNNLFGQPICRPKWTS